MFYSKRINGLKVVLSVLAFILSICSLNLGISFYAHADVVHSYSFYDEYGDLYTLENSADCAWYDSADDIASFTGYNFGGGEFGFKTYYGIGSNITLNETLEIQGDVAVILADNVHLVAPKGIELLDDSTLTIYTQSLGDSMGKITATGLAGKTGIGGVGAIKICGGYIIATGGSSAAGIGGSAGNYATVQIYNGKIVATAGSGAVAIGSGTGAFMDSTIEIHGGKFGSGDYAENTVYGVSVYSGLGVGPSGDLDCPYVVAAEYIDYIPEPEPTFNLEISSSSEISAGVDYTYEYDIDDIATLTILTDKEFVISQTSTDAVDDKIVISTSGAIIKFDGVNIASIETTELNTCDIVAANSSENYIACISGNLTVNAESGGEFHFESISGKITIEGGYIFIDTLNITEDDDITILGGYIDIDEIAEDSVNESITISGGYFKSGTLGISNSSVGNIYGFHVATEYIVLDANEIDDEDEYTYGVYLIESYVKKNTIGNLNITSSTYSGVAKSVGTDIYVLSTTCDDASYTCFDKDNNTTTSFVNVGDYKIVATVASQYYNGYYYLETSKEFDFTINGALINVKAVTEYSGDYDGLSHNPASISVETINSQSATISYSLDGTNFSTDLKLTNAKEYLVYYKVEAANHITATGSFTATINKISLVVKANDNTISYGSAPSGNNVAISGYVNNENSSVLSGSLSYTYTYTRYDNVGTYKITPSGLSSENYSITYQDGNLTVVKANITISADNISSEYGKAIKTLTYTIKSGEIFNSDNLNISLSKEEGEIVGTYQITITAENNNYNITLENGTYTITKELYDMSNVVFADKSYVYDGTEKVLMISGDLPSGVSVSYTTNKLTNVGSVLVTATFDGDFENYEAIDPMTARLTITKATYVLSESDFVKSDETIFGKEDGKITFVGSGLEYKYEDGDWHLIETDILENLKSGTYYIRKVGDANHNQSLAVSINILSGKKLSVAFSVLGGDAVLPIQNVAWNSEIDLTTYTSQKAGYKFLGWSLTENGEIVTSVLASESLTLYAVWEAEETITQNDNDNDSIDTTLLIIIISISAALAVFAIVEIAIFAKKKMRLKIKNS